MNRRNTGEKKRSFLLGRRSKANQKSPSRNGNRIRGATVSSSQHTSTTNNSHISLVDEAETTTFFDQLLEVGDQKKALFIERKMRVEEMEDTCAFMKEIVRIHSQQLDQALSKLAKRKQQKLVAAANRSNGMSPDDEEEEVIEELKSSIAEMASSLRSLAAKYESKQDSLVVARQHLAALEAEGDDEISILTQEAPVSSPSKGPRHPKSPPSNNPFDDDDEEEDLNNGQSSTNPFDDNSGEEEEDEHKRMPTAGAKDASGKKNRANPFVSLSEALSQQSSSISTKHEWLDWMETERLEKQVAQLSTQNEQTERAIYCLQMQMEESAQQSQ